jgi:hypothetical protein
MLYTVVYSKVPLYYFQIHNLNKVSTSGADSDDFCPDPIFSNPPGPNSDQVRYAIEHQEIFAQNCPMKLVCEGKSSMCSQYLYIPGIH